MEDKFSMTKKKILVTGGAGFIGSHLVDALVQEGHHVVVIDDLSTGKVENINQKAVFHEACITDTETIRNIVAGVDSCFHLAAVASVEKSQQDWYQTHKINAGGLVNLFDAISKLEKTVPVVYASSAAVYGDMEQSHLAESLAVHPITPYGADKYSCELNALIADQQFNIPTVGVRFFNVYGPRQDSRSPYSGVISIFNERIKNRKVITLYGDGSQTRDFIYVGDVINALLLSMDKLCRDEIRCDVFNICTGNATSLNDLMECFSKLYDVSAQVAKKAPRQGDIARSCGSTKKSLDILGFTAKTDLFSGLKALKGADQ